LRFERILNVFWNKLRIWEYPLCWIPNGRAIDNKTSIPSIGMAKYFPWHWLSLQRY